MPFSLRPFDVGPGPLVPVFRALRTGGSAVPLASTSMSRNQLTRAECAPSDEAYAAWQRAVAAVLAKARRVDLVDLGPEPESLLTTETYDGLTVQALYTGRDELPEQSLPGQAPFVRGRTAARDTTLGWDVCERHAGSDPAALNREILAGLQSGASALWLRTGAGGLPVDGLEVALAGVLLDMVPLVLEAGLEGGAAAEALYTILDAAPDLDRGAVDVCLGADPYTSRMHGRQVDGDLEAAVALAATAATRPGCVRALLVDATVFHDAGGGDADELAAALAAGVGYLRALVGGGLDTAAAFGQVDFRYAATDDQFQTIAKFRAARRLWARVAEVLGVPSAGAARQHAVTSSAMMSQRDPWTNLLRTTLAAFGAGVGGADTVTVLAFDSAIPGGAAGVSPAFAARIARNSQLLLLEEAHVGRVRDAAAGSWYVEELTDALAAAAWARFQQLEAAGGFVTALESGLLAELIISTRTRRENDIATRRTELTGVNEFPKLAEDPLPPTPPGVGHGAFAPTRYAAAYERLRDRSDAHLVDRGARPRVFLATLGPLADHNPRASFVTNLLAAGGVEAVNPGPLGSAAEAASQFRASGASVVVVCGSDKAYAAQGPATVSALRAAGAEQVLGAGTDRPYIDAAEQPDGYLALGTDVVAALTGLLDRLGVA